jgi:hypothetical protein
MAKAACELELEHIVDIKYPRDETDTRKLVYREALVEWENQHKLLQGKVETRTKRINQATNEIYQLVGLYSVFVGVVYTAVVQSNHLKCPHIWSPIILCVLAYLVVFTVTVKRFRDINVDLGTREEDDSFRKQAQRNLRELKRQGTSRISFLKLEESSDVKVCVEKSWKPVACFLTVLTLALIGSFVHIVCFP